MIKTFVRLLPIALLGSGVTLFGCDKQPDAVKPSPIQLTQNGEEGTVPTEDQLKQQESWLWYKEQIASGKAVDPLGQYAKESDSDSDMLAPDTTTVTKDGQITGGEHSDKKVVTKYDAADGKTDWGFHDYVARMASGSSTAHPCVDCLTNLNPTGGGGGGGGGSYPPPSNGGGAPITTVFVSSEGMVPYTDSDNPNGYIVDLKLKPSPPVFGTALQTNPTGIIRIPTGVNTQALARNIYAGLATSLASGTSGRAMYLCFTRVSSLFLGNPDIQLGAPNRDGFVRGLRSSYSSHFWQSPDSPPTNPNYLSIWEIDDSNRIYAAEVDLNYHAGGKYVWPFQTKDPNAGGPVEVGVLSGNSDQIMPPTGWVKMNDDLNRDAGGDYIYFCYKLR